MKKTLFTLAVDDYAPEICALTFPLMERYAEKIGADFHVITERKYPHYPPVFEKLQIHELGRDMGNDWNLYVDADALIHPDLFDITEHLSKDTVFHNGSDPASIRFKPDEYFRRDGRNIGSCNWFTIASDWCLDLWRPPTEPLDDLVQNITCIMDEARQPRTLGPDWRQDRAWTVLWESGGFASLQHTDKRLMTVVAETGVEAKVVMTPDHLIDDYTLSRNIARFGFKFKQMRDVLAGLKMNPASTFFHHTYTSPKALKAQELLKVLESWHLLDMTQPSLTFTPQLAR